jgi:citrate lyase gamma subunit
MRLAVAGDLEAVVVGIVVAPVQERLDKVTAEELVQIVLHAGVVAVVEQVLLEALVIQVVMPVVVAMEAHG